MMKLLCRRLRSNTADIVSELKLNADLVGPDNFRVMSACKSNPAEPLTYEVTAERRLLLGGIERCTRVAHKYSFQPGTVRGLSQDEVRGLGGSLRWSEKRNGRGVAEESAEINWDTLDF